MSSTARNQLKQSNYLINNQGYQVSFFDHSYKSYKPFSRLTKKIGFDNTFEFGKKVSLNLSNHASYADLITNLTVMVKLPDISGTDFGYTNGLGHALIEKVEFKMDGVLIDEHTSEWLDIWSELTIKPGLQKNYKYLVKKSDVNSHTNFRKGNIYVPLQFWFCQNSSSNSTKNNMILPIAALYDTRIELVFTIRSLNDLVINKAIDGTDIASSHSIISADLLVDYIVLDEDNLKDLQKPNVEKFYLISQLQKFEKNVPANTTSMNITFPEIKYIVSELIWVVTSDDAVSKNIYFSYGTNLTSKKRDPISKTKIKFDGADRVEELPSEYFQSVEPLAVHDNTPFSFIHCYSFALSPEDFSQPSGICNFSEIHNTEFGVTFKSGIGASKFKLFAINYNVIKVKNGKFTLFSNLSNSTRASIPDDNNNNDDGDNDGDNDDNNKSTRRYYTPTKCAK